jgi:muconolactone delta-isomerase
MQFMIEFKMPKNFTEEMSALIPEQRAIVDELLAENLILSYTLSFSKHKLWVVIDAETEADAFDIMAELPLTKYMKIDIHPLMFHDSADMVYTFSAN